MHFKLRLIYARIHRDVGAHEIIVYIAVDIIKDRSDVAAHRSHLHISNNEGRLVVCIVCKREREKLEAAGERECKEFRVSFPKTPNMVKLSKQIKSDARYLD